MKKRHLQNCLSKERRAFESNIKKYKTWIEIERADTVDSDSEDSKILDDVPVINESFITEPEAFASACGQVSDSDSKSSNGEEKMTSSSYTLLGDVNEILPQSSKSSLPKSEDVFTILKFIVQRLAKLEQNQAYIMQNQSILGNGQHSILASQQQIAAKLEKIEESIVSKPEMMAQTNLLMECKVAIKNVEQSVCRMTGETPDRNLDEVVRMLPLQTLAAVQEVEQKLDTPDFAQAMTTYLHKLKGTSEDVSSIIRAIFTDDLLQKYNWDGRWEKLALRKLMLVNRTLRDVFQQHGGIDFEKSVKKALERSHNRLKQKKYLNK